jgi:hypothetical protein
LVQSSVFVEQVWCFSIAFFGLAYSQTLNLLSTAHQH